MWIFREEVANKQLLAASAGSPWWGSWELCSGFKDFTGSHVSGRSPIREASWLLPLQVRRSWAKANGCLEKWSTEGPAQGEAQASSDICPPAGASRIKEMIPVGSVVSAA